ncbi:MAG TPA: hypothetical protein VK815_15970 [Candidatus Acidoferrales bacterium]|jgi:hypothetical protein|nr:hypothetical protein [Candidatus Acidoferrales bacterium]
MKRAFIILALLALTGLELRADNTFTATYVDTDGLDQIGSQNNITFYFNFDPAGDTTWTWAVFGWQNNWYFCNYTGDVWGAFTPLTDDGTNISFTTDQFGGVSPDCVTVGNSITNVMFAEGASAVYINLNLDPSGTNLLSDAASVTNGAIPHVTIITFPPVAPAMQLTGQLLGNGDMRLTCGGISGTNYALDRTFNLVAPAWVPQATNIAGANGLVIFTNTPDPTANNFWRVRSVP